MIAVLHAYSRHNSGDGLLVDLTLERLARHGIGPADCVVYALDPASFADLPQVEKVGTAGRAVDRELAGAVLGAAALAPAGFRPSLAVGRVARLLAGAEAFVAVGGGYLRAGSRANALGTAVNHLPQVRAAVATGRPSLYLPQSIGPLAGPVGRAVRTALAKVGTVHARDDRSVAALGRAPNVVRTPDLAVLRLAEDLPDQPTTAADGPAVIIARDLSDRDDRYDARFLDLAARLGDVVWAVQAEGAVEKSDRTFYERLGVTPAGTTGTVLGPDGPAAGPVVSVRLHGALESLLAGRPVVHLGYERKSWGAYEDLGLGEWVHPARSFDPAVVAAQVAELRADPGRFWAAVAERRPQLLAASARLDDDVAAVVRR